MGEPALVHEPPTSGWPTAGSGLTLLLTLAIPALVLVDLLSRRPWSIWAFTGISAVFIARAAAQMSSATRRTASLLLLVTCGLLPWVDAPLSVLERGLRIGALIAALLVSIHLLSRAVSRVGQVRSVMQSLHQVRGPQRYAVLSVASQFFGGLLGLAGIAMLMESTARQPHRDAADAVSSFSAISRGYAALSLWSPMYSNMSIALSLHPGVHWTMLLPVAMAITALFLLLGIVLDHFGRATFDRSQSRTTAVGPLQLVKQAWPVLLAMLAFLGLMVATSQGFGLPIAAVIIVGAPLAAWCVNTVARYGSTQAIRLGGRQTIEDLATFPTMAGEVAMFIASGCAGSVIGSAIPPAWTGTIGAALHGSPAWACFTVSAAIVLLSGLALHPMLSAVIVSASLDPSLLQLPVLVHLAAVLIGWGLAIIVTPFSVISALATRWSGIPILTISLQANALYVASALALSATVLGMTTRMLTS